MKFQSSTLLALAMTAATAVVGINTPGVQGWSLGHGPSSLFFSSPLLLLDEDETALAAPSDTAFLLSPSSMMSRAMERQRQLARSMMLDRPITSSSSSSSLMSPSFSSPWRYELVDDDEKFQLSVDVPGVEMKDLDVSVDEENGFLTVAGQRTVSSKNDETGASSKYSSKFSQTFALDDAVDLDQFSADLKNGVLVVTAPKDLKRLEETIDDRMKRIPITSAEAPAPTATLSQDTLTEDDTPDVNDEEAVLDLDNEVEQESMPTTKKENSKIHHVQINNEGE
mmetsp:Transcript_55634/g.134859  ORF Transcript_55634/g.134859 Transcript_55634/m.134859 type:complete len:282 (+) Transcript_55634:317-1162(+)